MSLTDNLAHTAMVGLMAGALAACNAGADATQAPSAAKNSCSGPNGCGQVEETTKASTAGAADEGGQAKVEAKGDGCSGPNGCGGADGCPAHDEAKDDAGTAKADVVEGAEATQPATKSGNSCSGANGCENS